MKTNQNLTRMMGEFKVVQRTSDGMFNATALLKQWNFSHSQQKRDLDNFWKSANLDKLMATIAKRELNFKSVEFTVLKNTLSISHRGKTNGGTWMHPILFIKFAMYLSPEFEYDVLRFVSDQLLQYRNDAGDAYKDLCSTVAGITDSKKMPVAIAIQNTSKALNYIVFGMHVSEIRNKKAEEPLLKELLELEKKVTSLIEDGFIKNYEELMGYLRKQWTKKWQPSLLSA